MLVNDLFKLMDCEEMVSIWRGNELLEKGFVKDSKYGNFYVVAIGHDEEYIEIIVG